MSVQSVAFMHARLCMAQINTIVELPSRRDAGPFYFSIDHCFPNKGQGTVITGTVLSGTVKVRIIHVICTSDSESFKMSALNHLRSD